MLRGWSRSRGESLGTESHLSLLSSGSSRRADGAAASAKSATREPAASRRGSGGLRSSPKKSRNGGAGSGRRDRSRARRDGRVRGGFGARRTPQQGSGAENRRGADRTSPIMGHRHRVGSARVGSDQLEPRQGDSRSGNHGRQVKIALQNIGTCSRRPPPPPPPRVSGCSKKISRARNSNQDMTQQDSKLSSILSLSVPEIGAHHKCEPNS